MKSIILFFMAISMLFLSLLPRIFSLSSYYAAAAIVFADLYLVSTLFSAAAKTDIKLKKNSAWDRFTNAVLPSKREGLVIFGLLLPTLIFGFANLYIELPGGVKHGDLYLTGFYDGVYFSCITIATVGYGDFVPVSHAAKAFVLWELGSGILLVVGGFGLLISRLANYK